MPLMNIRLNIQYEGTRYSGWQYQPNDTTIQGEIEAAIKKVTGKDINIYGAGRTDAGVHALGQVANFRIDHNIQAEKYRDAINFYLPKDILITDSFEVDDEFHARKSARWRQYRYHIGLKRTALYFNLRWELNRPLDIERMNTLAKRIIGKHDFASFCVVSSLKDNNDCEIHLAKWEKHGDLLIFKIRANRFLHTMVRSLVGCMVDAGRDKDYLTLDKFEDILNSYDHTRITTVAPARGLYLEAVGY
jgi:tRNA pseudouridine38-40 synthase